MMVVFVKMMMAHQSFVVMVAELGLRVCHLDESAWVVICGTACAIEYS